MLADLSDVIYRSATSAMKKILITSKKTYSVCGATLEHCNINQASLRHQPETVTSESRTFITVQTKPPYLAKRGTTKDSEETAEGNVSPWTGRLRPGRSRWWRRSRPPTERPILCTAGQRHRQISSIETTWTEQSRMWRMITQMAGNPLSKTSQWTASYPTHTYSRMG